MEHKEFLGKVKAAKKHLAEFRYAGAKVYHWMLLLGALGAFVNSTIFPSHPNYAFISLGLGFIGGALFLYKMTKGEKEFKTLFPEESRTIDEFNELLK